MVILRSQNKITDFLMILAWASISEKNKIHQYEIVPALGQRIVFAGIYLTRYTDALSA